MWRRGQKRDAVVLNALRRKNGMRMCAGTVSSALVEGLAEKGAAGLKNAEDLAKAPKLQVRGR